MESEVTIAEENGKQIIANLNHIFELRGRNKNEFIRYCREKHQMTINSGNFGRIFKEGKGDKLKKITLAFLCEFLEVSMEDVILNDMTKMENVGRTLIKNKEENYFKYENVKDQFEKYEGEYYCYFYPTTNEMRNRNQIVTAKLQLMHPSTEKYVKAIIDIIPRGKYGNDYKKRYEGIVMISSRLDICSCIVLNEKIGEISFLSFRFLKNLNSSEYLGGAAAVTTVSADLPRVPVMHRMLISKRKLSEPELRDVMPYIRMNHSEIMISAEELQHMFEENHISETLRNRVLTLCEEKSYYKIKEEIIRGLPIENTENQTASEFIGKMRERAEAYKYDKIGAKLDEHIINILRKRPGQRQRSNE